MESGCHIILEYHSELERSDSPAGLEATASQPGCKGSLNRVPCDEE